MNATLRSVMSARIRENFRIALEMSLKHWEDEYVPGQIYRVEVDTQPVEPPDAS